MSGAGIPAVSKLGSSVKDPAVNGGWVTTPSGVCFSLAEPRPEDVRLDDVARGLSRIIHFGGALSIDLTVAEHTLLGRRLALQRADGELGRLFLLHDAAEAYMGDLRGPLKHLTPDLVAIEERIRRAVYERFGLEHRRRKRWADVEALDFEIIRAEAWMLPTRGEDWDPPVDVADFAKLFPPGRPVWPFHHYAPMRMADAQARLLKALRAAFDEGES